jgi:hypothetical protein
LLEIDTAADKPELTCRIIDIDNKEQGVVKVNLDQLQQPTR